MNWTEGSLARLSRGPGWQADLERQKAYFAKVRSGRLDASKPDISTISFFQQIPLNPPVDYLKSSKDHHVLSSPYFKPQLSQRSAQKGVSDHGRASRQPHHGGDPFASGPDRSRDRSMIAHSGKRLRVTDTVNTFDAKRRKLLQKGDWAGLRMQDSIPIEFPAHENRKGQVWNFQSSKRPRDQLPFADKHGRAPRGRLLPHYGSTQDRSPSVQIRIGSECLRSTVASQQASSSPCIRVSTKRSTSKVKQKLVDRQPSSSKDPSRRLLHQYPRQHRYGDDTQSGSVAPRKRWSQGNQGSIPRTYEGAVDTMIPPRPYEASRHFRRDDQSLFVETSPAVIHHPIPQRVFQDKIEALSPNNESTAGVLGYDEAPIGAVSKKENDWRAMLAKMEGHFELTQDPGLVDLPSRPNISPGLSNLPILESSSSSSVSEIADSFALDHPLEGNFTATEGRSPCCEVAYGPRFDYPPMSTSPETRDLAARQVLPADDTPARAANHSTDTTSERCSDSKSPESTTSFVPPAQRVSESVFESLSGSGSESEAGKKRLAADQPASRYTDSDDSEEQLVLDEHLSRFADSSDDDFSGPSEDAKETENPITQGEDQCIRKPLSMPFFMQNSQSSFPLFSQKAKPEEEPFEAKPATDKNAEAAAAWLEFLFPSDIEDTREAAFKVAVHDAARDMRPSSSASDVSNPAPQASSLDQDTETVATCGTVVPQRQIAGNAFPSAFSPDPQLSRPADWTPFPPSFSPDSDLRPSSSPVQAADRSQSDIEHRKNMPEITQTHHHTRAPKSVVSLSSSSSRASASTGGFTTDAASIIAQTSGSECGKERRVTYTQPKIFVGRSANTATRQTKPPPAAKIPKPNSKPRGRPKKTKKGRDGRANIRAVPNYDEDPISDE